MTHISERKTREIIRLFSLDIEAKKTAELTGISRQTIDRFYTAFRKRIAEICEAESPFENGEVELDECYFGARSVRGKRGRGARGKTPVFGMLKRGEKVYTQIVKRCSVRTVQPFSTAGNRDWRKGLAECGNFNIFAVEFVLVYNLRNRP